MNVLPEKGHWAELTESRERLITVEEAIDVAVAMVQPLTETEEVALARARGRVLARDLHAVNAMPFFDNSAMDGFALMVGDLPGQGPWCLPVAGTVAAGGLAPVLEPGTALRIFTGAPVPAASDAVIVQEACEDRGDSVLVTMRPASGDNIRRRGEDVAVGDLLAAAGTIIDARHIGVLAGNGFGSLPVMRRPRIGILSTGDELAGGAANIHDVNRPMLLALCEGAGAEVIDLGICPDDRARMTEFLTAEAGPFDMILTSGAASMGGRDFMRPALLAAGGAVEACRVALKPGKPVFFGRMTRTLVTGLPGNPFAAYVGFQLFVKRQISAMLGVRSPEDRIETAEADFGWTRKSGRREYVPAKEIGRNADGLPVLQRLGHGSSAALVPLASADGIIVLDASATHGARGDLVEWMPFYRTDVSWRIT
ncbi:molybdopterin molybdotransferase MoeA [Rhizobium sp. S-51]|jgi:molybdopterin molybdotransferase|uniref:Molybdopterin molybdenumtransferase n=1 Tax=Rhizobium terricola TaxID=2728849 RepID=A0A7Y0FY70_9HYPH|nr:gephyrin-like molybdotransferase Glp [Rhizobium terricola]NML76379.1 molybdopterin molybdotransferase MoeA [Rhizobium terricola]